MADRIETLNIVNSQLNNLDSFKNKNCNIIISNASYEDLLNVYRSNDIDTGNKSILESINKSIIISAPTETSNKGIDSGEYTIIVIAPDGRPIKITPGFSSLSKYFKITDSNDGYKQLDLDIVELSKELVTNKDSALYKKDVTFNIGVEYVEN